MNRTLVRGPAVFGIAVLAAAVSIEGRGQTATEPAATGVVPKTWDDEAWRRFKGVGVEHRAVKGHPFGLRLSSDDKRALIAFLRTL